VHGDFTDGLAAILKLHPIRYDFKTDAKHVERAGFGTQEVEPYLHNAVFHDAADGMASLDDRPITAALVNATKELSKRISELETETADLPPASAQSHADWPARAEGAAAILLAGYALYRTRKFRYSGI
jgi:hypothetical protein